MTNSATHSGRTRRRRALYAFVWSAATFCGATACLLGIGSILDTRSPNLAFPPPSISAAVPPTAVAPTAVVASPSPTIRPAPRSAARPTPPPDIHTYDLDGGRVTLLVEPAVARIVAVRPRAGCTVQTWTAVGWLRVDFGCGLHVSAFFVTWNGTAPRIQSANF